MAPTLAKPTDFSPDHLSGQTEERRSANQGGNQHGRVEARCTLPEHGVQHRGDRRQGSRRGRPDLWRRADGRAGSAEISGSLSDDAAGGTQLGKRYGNADETIELLATKAGDGSLAADGGARDRPGEDPPRLGLSHNRP